MENALLFNNVSEITISYKTKFKAQERPKIVLASTAARILRNHWSADNIEYIEEFKILLLNQANRVLGIRHVSTGGAAACPVDPKIVFQAALKANAAGIILCHNHPSGNLEPSSQDRDLTKQLINGGKLLAIRVIDHIILSSDSYYSFMDEGDTF